MKQLHKYGNADNPTLATEEEIETFWSSFW
jgi:hypothetical protein